MKIQMISNKQEKKQGTKTVWITTNIETKEITEQEYNNIVGIKTLKWFRNLGGSESVTREYTKHGYDITRLTSTSPDKQMRNKREFRFE